MYYSTRSYEKATASEALLKGLASDGGLYLIENIPLLDYHDLLDLSYQEIAKKVLMLYFDDFSEEEINHCVYNAYNQNNFQENEIISIESQKRFGFLNLCHGKTLAFKDMALSILPHLIEKAKEKHHIVKKTIVLTATSGDTGSSALANFQGLKNTVVYVLYPSKGISEIQERQMIKFSTNGNQAFKIEGNFDDCQRIVKNIFKENISEDYELCSANSINIGRLIPQIIYYFVAYINLIKKGIIKNGQQINVSVPTGNFGNILAAFYAKKMGLPINTLICASNENDVLNDFFRTGKYSVKRDFQITNSPSMDILVSSNLERLLAIEFGDKQMIKRLYENLSIKKEFEVGKKLLEKFSYIKSYTTNQHETLNTIKDVYLQFGILIDPHTAVAYHAYKQHQDDTYTLICETASYQKFPNTIVEAFGLDFCGNEIEKLKSINHYFDRTLNKHLSELHLKRASKTINEEKLIKFINRENEIEVKVPMTSANFGPGFDFAGCSFNVFNIFRIKKSDSFELVSFSDDFNKLENNLIYKTYVQTFLDLGKKPIPITISVYKQNVPVERGLGSSAICIVLGVFLANYYLYDSLSEEEAIRLMIKFEGHPDNVVSAYLGGFNITINGEKLLISRSQISKQLKFYFLIPKYKLNTVAARSVLPDSLDYQDIIFNTSRASILQQALRSGNLSLLKIAVEDKMHTPYRIKLISRGREIFEYFREKEACCLISGAGPTLMIILKDENIIKSFEKEYQNCFDIIKAKVYEKKVKEKIYEK